jgi:hypothetical protein
VFQILNNFTLLIAPIWKHMHWSQHDDGLFFFVQTAECIRVFVPDGFAVIIHLLIFQALYFVLLAITNDPYLVLVSKLVLHTWQLAESIKSLRIEYIYWDFGCFRQRVIENDGAAF